MSKYIGDVSAYAYAVSKGYTGTEEEFAELMASYATVGQTAVDAKDAAVAAKTAAQTAATTATNKASEATTAAQTATTKAGEASTSANTATSAKDTAVSASQTATTKATEATTAATSANTAKTDAVAAKTAAETAQGKAETAQGAAEDAAESVSASAAQIVTNTADITDLKKDLTTVSAKVSAIEEAEGLHKYGVSGIGQSASALTRIWDSVGMTAQVGTDGDNSNVVNNFDDVTPFNRRKCVGHWETRNGGAHFVVEAYYGEEGYAEDGSKGDYAAVECPRAYYYLKDGILGVSAHHYHGWRPFDIFCRNHDEEDTFEYAYLPAYALAVDADGHAVSLPGLDNAQGNYAQLLNMARTYKGGALGGFAVIQPAAVNFYEWALFTVEFAQQNSQTVMQGCTSLRHSNDDRVTFVDATHLLTSNYFAARVAGQYISVIAADIDINNSGYLATHKVTAVTRCDAAGNASASGTHQLLTVEDLGRNYYEYDITGATEYRIAARPYRTGCCDGVSTPSGSPVSNNDTFHPMRYRWRENVYGNQFKTSVDLFNKRIGTGDDDYYLEHYYLHDPANYVPANTNKPDAADLQTAVFTKLDVETPHSKYINGYVKSKVYSTEYPDIWIPDETTGGSASTFFADYANLVNSFAVRSVRFGGYWYYGSYAGFSYFSGYNGPANGSARYGGDLCFIQAGGESAA